MELVALLILAFAAVLTGGGLVQVFRGMLSREGLDANLAEDGDAARLGELAERKEMVTQLILSTELDLQTDKIAEADHAATIHRLKREAVVIMKEMDAIAGTEDDAERAQEALEAYLRTARATDGDRQWSAAARIRHGGKLPTAQEAS